MSIGWKPKNPDFNNAFVQRCGGLLSMYFTTMFFCTIEICKHVNVTSILETSFDMIIVEIDFNCNGEMFCKPKWHAFLVFGFIQPCGSHFYEYCNK